MTAMMEAGNRVGYEAARFILNANGIGIDQRIHHTGEVQVAGYVVVLDSRRDDFDNSKRDVIDVTPNSPATVLEQEAESRRRIIARSRKPHE